MTPATTVQQALPVQGTSAALCSCDGPARERVQKPRWEQRRHSPGLPVGTPVHRIMPGLHEEKTPQEVAEVWALPSQLHQKHGNTEKHSYPGRDHHSAYATNVKAPDLASLQHSSCIDPVRDETTHNNEEVYCSVSSVPCG
eukprot:CAMPEP_0115157462 /NCGR_PEP_ID=MMETSP0227-20121206/69055_1 /TAXON_ID=89957 /ORGANISM="Polarella glacialis, Strain CCMP 1383" /LENGTH=140 /DNA_ID=CAMNT_0002568835 /DNA_START=133 /DNA_END=555 /DNA_ORIENTATION=-